MLDEIEKVAMELLGMSKEEVRQVRDALLVEVAMDDARYAARTALKHPEGSTTPLNEAADRAQQAYAKVREKVTEQLPKLLGLILAEKVAREQRDEAAIARDRHWDAEHERRAVGPHPETRDLFGRLFKHGVTPWHLKALRDEEVAIIADMIRWKANDARYKNADNPWRQVLQDYAGRLILEADYGVTVKRSKRGTPVRAKRYTSPKYYMFNEMVESHWGLAPTAVDQSIVEAAASESGDDEASPEPEHQVGDAAPIETPEATESTELAIKADDDTPMAAHVPEADEYALPQGISDADAATLLVGGQRWVDLDDEWPFELKYAIGSAKTDTDAIAAVAAATQPVGATPFRYFLDAAERHGVDAGHAAYREATARRFAFEFATKDEWKDVRGNLGLPW